MLTEYLILWSSYKDDEQKIDKGTKMRDSWLI